MEEGERKGKEEPSDGNRMERRKNDLVKEKKKKKRNTRKGKPTRANKDKKTRLHPSLYHVPGDGARALAAPQVRSLGRWFLCMRIAGWFPGLVKSCREEDGLPLPVEPWSLPSGTSPRARNLLAQPIFSIPLSIPLPRARDGFSRRISVNPFVLDLHSLPPSYLHGCMLSQGSPKKFH